MLPGDRTKDCEVLLHPFLWRRNEKSPLVVQTLCCHLPCTTTRRVLKYPLQAPSLHFLSHIQGYSVRSSCNLIFKMYSCVLAVILLALAWSVSTNAVTTIPEDSPEPSPIMMESLPPSCNGALNAIGNSLQLREQSKKLKGSHTRRAKISSTICFTCVRDGTVCPHEC